VSARDAAGVLRHRDGMAGSDVMTTMRAGALELEVLRRGEGRAILLIHGVNPISPRAPFVDRLARHGEVIAPSHPGFGTSSLPDWLDSIDDVAHIYLEFLDRIGGDSFDVVACSVGGWIAAEMATKAPQRFRRLVLVGPVGIKVGPPDKLDIPDLFAMPQADADKLVFREPAKVLPDVSKLSDEELALMFRARETMALLVWEPWMHNPKLKHRLHRIAAPTLFARGEADGLVSSDYLAAYARFLPNARTLTIPGAGHLPHLEQPKLLADAIGGFLEN